MLHRLRRPREEVNSYNMNMHNMYMHMHMFELYADQKVESYLCARYL